MRRLPVTLALSCTVSVLALAAAPAAAQTTGAGQGPATQDCSAIADEAARQSCADSAEAADPQATSGSQADIPTGAPASAEGTQEEQGPIVVTGSRLRRDERSSVDPVTIIDPSAEAREGRFSTAEVLQSSPIAAGSTQITSTLSTNFVVNGGEGVQTVSLRGLGANRTLVLLNGRRAGPAGVRGGVSAFDLNVIPTDVIQTIDILKTGASSVYGSDAVAGVVNLITKKNQRGFDARAFVSIPGRHGGEQYNVSGSYGLRLGDRGHAMIGVNYQRQRELERGDRSFLGCEEEFVTNQSGQRSDPIDPRTGQPYCGLFLNDVILISDFGLMNGSNLLGPPVPNSTGGTTRRPIGAVQFDRSGGLGQYVAGVLKPPANITQFGAPAGFIPVGAFNATGLAIENTFDARVLGDSVIPDTKRFTVFAEAGYELTDRIDLYFEGLYNNRKTRTDASRQLFFNQFPGNAATIYTQIYGGGYYLPYFFCDGTTCNPNATGDPLNKGFTGANLIQPVIYAPFDSSTNVNYYRGVAGLRANLDNILTNGFADFYVQHSRSDGDYARQIIFRDAVEFGVAELRTGLCAGTKTAIRGVPCIDINYTDPRVLRGDFTPAEQAFLFGIDRGNTLYKQTNAELSFGGDVFRLPAGAVKVALGGTWRRDSINDTPGEATLQNNLFASTSSGVTAGFQRTVEGFGEIEIPLLKDIPGIQSLTFSGAARVTNTYAERQDGASDSDKGNWTYKLALNWQVVDFLRLRSTYGTSFRSPALYEQFLANETGFLGQSSDPCIRYGQSENATLKANCASIGISPTFAGGGSSFETFSQGGVGLLDPETSKALTASVIFTPSGWLWNDASFSLVVDYIDIKVSNQVTQLGAGSILAGCYTSDNFQDEPLCDLITRNPSTGPDAFAIAQVRDPFLNIDEQRNKSLDVTARFRQDLGRYGTLSLLGQMTYQLKDRYTLFQGITENYNGEVGDPKWVGDLNVSWALKPVTITYGLQVIAGTNDFEDLQTVGGTNLTADNCLATAGAYALRGGPYCPVYKLPRVAYHSLSADIRVNDKFTFLVGVSNLFDKKPPRISTVGSPISGFGQVPTVASYYDYLGRRFFASVRAGF
ncbi:MAG TPA: TonB-dependent receptor [Allosphingosinicella sp.]|jgi:iron complex outermembrane receptor protein